MHIAHVALWAIDIDKLKGFYETYFDASAGPCYVNAAKGFTSYFLSFPSGARLEIMARADQCQRPEANGLAGFAHLAFSVGSAAQVDALTLRLEQAGYPRLDGPRRTGDGYYESVILDPEGNRIEVTI